MSKYIAALLLLASVVRGAPPAWASPLPSASTPSNDDPVALLKDTMDHLGKDKDHPYIIPYCGGQSMNISAENAGFLPQSDSTGDTTLPDNLHILMVGLDTPFDVTPYDNALAAFIIDLQMPASHPEWADDFNITALMFTSKSKAKFDGRNLLSNDPSKKVVMQLAFSFTSEFSATDDDSIESADSSVYACITSPFVRMPLPDSLNEASTLTSKDAGKYVVELGYILTVGPRVNVSEIFFSDVYLTCLPAPTPAELADQGITYWKKEISPGRFVLSPALAAARK